MEPQFWLRALPGDRREHLARGALARPEIAIRRRQVAVPGEVGDAGKVRGVLREVRQACVAEVVVDHHPEAPLMPGSA